MSFMSCSWHWKDDVILLRWVLFKADTIWTSNLIIFDRFSSVSAQCKLFVVVANYIVSKFSHIQLLFIPLHVVNTTMALILIIVVWRCAQSPSQTPRACCATAWATRATSPSAAMFVAKTSPRQPPWRDTNAFTHQHSLAASVDANRYGLYHFLFLKIPLKLKGNLKYRIKKKLKANTCHLQMILRALLDCWQSFCPYTHLVKMVDNIFFFPKRITLWTCSEIHLLLTVTIVSLIKVCTLDNEGAAHLFPCPHCPSRFNTEDQLNHHK